MELSGLDDMGREFLLAVFARSGGAPSRQLSMFEVGSGLGWERELASRTAQDLMGLGLLEIRTLSGGIGLSTAGAEVVRAERTPQVPPIAAMGRGPVMTPAECRLAADVCAQVRTEAAAVGRLSPEMEADLLTLAAQFASPRPKAAIVRACLRSLLDAVAPGAGPGRSAIEALLGE
jgi:hypothetical protein